LEAFARFSTKRSIARFLAKEKIFQEVLHINGSIIECGVFNGAGLFAWAQFSSIFEPVNHSRKIIGFDTFAGFPSVAAEDGDTNKAGDLFGDSVEAMQKSIELYDSNRPVSHIPKVQLVAGDFMLTAEKYLQENPHLLVALLYLDFDLYEPTKKALEVFIPRMPKGAIIAFDELNCQNFPGETLALLESLDINKQRLMRSEIDPWISYFKLND